MCARYDPDWIAGLLSDQRVHVIQPDVSLRDAGVTPGATVVDLGCGPGFMTLPAAQIVGREGHVYAIDIEPSMLEYVDTAAEEAGLRNITVVLATPESVPLPDGIADFAGCWLVMHYVEAAKRPAIARELARLCKPGGTILVIQWLPRPGAPRWDRIPIEETLALLSDAGLHVLETQTVGPADQEAALSTLYRVLAEKPDQRRPS